MASEKAMVKSLTPIMNEYRITKYSPAKRSSDGCYFDSDEWTEFSDVGNSVTLDEYECIEKAYIEAAIEMLESSAVKSLQVFGLNSTSYTPSIKENSLVSLGELPEVLRSLLRGEYWCRLESESGVILVNISSL